MSSENNSEQPKQDELPRLSSASLSKLDSDSSMNITKPSYDRSKLTPGILQINPGNFHRAFEATFLEDLFHQGLDHDWAIVGAGISKGSKNIRALLEPQDWLYTVVERDSDTVTPPKVVGALVDFVPQTDDLAPLKRALLDPRIRIVSLTVTEGGYYLNQNTGKFDPDKYDDIQADVKNPNDPRTIFGMLVQALDKRRKEKVAPFTVLSCDNLPHNGDVTRSVVVGLARLVDPELAFHIDTHVTFPNSVVDRIVPKTSDKEREYIRQHYRYEDQWPIFCEPFRQWFIEDRFVHGARPQLEKVDGVTFVEDVSPYETMKIRILNAGHATLCYPAALLGVEYVHEAVEHPLIGPFLDKVERTEIIPGVPPVPDVDLNQYWETVRGRFSNWTIYDRIDRNCNAGSDRQSKFIIPNAMSCVGDGRKADGLAMVSAFWCRFCQGKTEAGETITTLREPQWDRLQENAKKAGSDPSAWLGMEDIYGDLGKDEKFVESFASALKMIETEGVEAALRMFIDS